MEGFVLWLLCGLAAAFIAGTKQRGAGWSLLGFIFGPIGLLVVCFLPKIEPRPPADNTTTTCPFCAETIKRAAIACKHCGRDLPPPPPPQP